MASKQTEPETSINGMAINRPARWDTPFDSSMSAASASDLLRVEPFASMDEGAFSSKVPLTGVLQNDCRLVELESGDIIVREGDYGNSAFLILEGSALVSLRSLPDSILGRSQAGKKRGWLGMLAQAWQQPRHAEVRDYSDAQISADDSQTGTRIDGESTRVFLHDIPRVIPADGSVELQTGEIFGEISALTRSPRSATVVANSKTLLLEIRWQGFRELLKRDSALKNHVETLYRQNSLRAHLDEIEIFRDLPANELEEIWRATRFESFGDFQWNNEFKSTKRKDIADRIHAETLIAEEGQAADDLILIRSGFARLSRQHGDGHQTIAYLGKGQTFGLRELTHNAATGEKRPWTLSLRAVGYVDVLKIPRQTICQSVLPNLKASQLPPPLPPQAKSANERSKSNRRLAEREETLDTSLLEFLVDKRLVNGTNAMVIDLDRCTRCDDCVRACASTHDNNPRFNRSGEIHDHWMIAQACMHCLDPVCMIGCPTGAIGRNEETGTVKINDSTCIGCSTCANSCPYQNIQMVNINDHRGLPIVDSDQGKPIAKATKCDLCESHGGGPACQRACPHDALVRIDLSTPDSFIQLH